MLSNRRQTGSDREMRVTLERRSGKKKQLCPAEQAQFIAFFGQTEASRERARLSVSESRTEGGVQKKKGETSCTLYLCQLFKLIFP